MNNITASACERRVPNENYAPHSSFVNQQIFSSRRRGRLSASKIVDFASEADILSLRNQHVLLLGPPTDWQVRPSYLQTSTLNMCDFICPHSKIENGYLPWSIIQAINPYLKG